MDNIETQSRMACGAFILHRERAESTATDEINIVIAKKHSVNAVRPLRFELGTELKFFDASDY